VRTINCHHNFTQLEHHMGKDLWITRKRAIKAGQGDEGVIPGSMSTRSYVVRGLGSTASYTSCSHGAGRRMSRTAARKQLTVDSLRAAMAGRAWNAESADRLLDEHPASYKDIDQVMADQTDLVAVQHTLRQVSTTRVCEARLGDGGGECGRRRPQHSSTSTGSASTTACCAERMTTEEQLTRVLSAWAAGSVAVGAVCSLSPRTRGFGRQTAAWGLVDGAIAYAGVRARRRKGPTDPARLRTVLLVNAGLDVG